MCEHVHDSVYVYACKAFRLLATGSLGLIQPLHKYNSRVLYRGVGGRGEGALCFPPRNLMSQTTSTKIY